MRILIIGGSGFLSGTVARRAVAQGHQVWVVTRGRRATPDGVTALTADRNDAAAFARAISEAGVTWDLAVDCIGFNPAHAEQDVQLLSPRVGRLVFISTDFVFEPAGARLPRDENTAFTTQPGYGADKQACEQVLAQASAEGRCAEMKWTILRPCHIYGPGSLLGCLPAHGRDADLLLRLKRGERLKLVGGGYFLQQPIYADDLAAVALACAGHAASATAAFNIAGPDIIESRIYYQIVAEVLGVKLKVDELPVADYLAAHPESRPFLAHRIYDLSRLRAAGLPLPATPIAVGLERQVRSLETPD